MAALRKIGFDAICLNAALTELASLVGSKVQKVVTPNEHVVVFQLYLRGATWLNIGTQPEFMTLFAQESPPERGDLTEFGQVLRKGLVNSRLEKVEQVGFDRVFKLHFSHEDGPMTLVGELMGKHSNLVLLAGKRTIGALKWVGPSKSTRPILPGRDYAPPPFEPKTPLPRLAEGADLKSADGVSPTVRDLLGAMPLQDLQRLIIAKKFTPCYSPGYGAYPFDLSQLGYPVTACKSFFEALALAWSQEAERDLIERARQRLLRQVERALGQREAAITDLENALQDAERANRLQREGELILTYQGMWQGQGDLEVWDYDGSQIQIKMNSELSVKDNAETRFRKAKRAKEGRPMMLDQMERLKRGRDELIDMVTEIEQSQTQAEIEQLRATATARNWLQRAQIQTDKADRPYEGHRIKELVAPGGYAVLYGENATSNDYLTLRVAKPSDIWLHVRGAVSAHVIIRTHNQPEKVQKETLLWAARVAANHSPQKHSEIVAVDYTLKKYVRRPRGAAAGTVIYEREKTLHVTGLAH